MPGEYRELTEKEKDTLCSVEKAVILIWMQDADGFHVDLAGSGPDLLKKYHLTPPPGFAKALEGKKLHRDRTVFSGCISRALLKFAGRCAKE